MEYSKSGLHLTESFEGLRLVAYQDSKGVWTIGYGHTKGVTAGMTCTVAQADAWAQEDIHWAESIVNRDVTVPLTQAQFDAAVDFTFNCGCHDFETSTMLKLINLGKFHEAALEFPKWDMCGGQHLAGLLRRRQAEEAEFEGAAEQ